MGFELTISAGERPQTYALERAANGTGDYMQIVNEILETRAGSNFGVEQPRQHGVINHSTKI